MFFENSENFRLDTYFHILIHCFKCVVFMHLCYSRFRCFFPVAAAGELSAIGRESTSSCSKSFFSIISHVQPTLSLVGWMNYWQVFPTIIWLKSTTKTLTLFGRVEKWHRDLRAATQLCRIRKALNYVEKKSLNIDAPLLCNLIALPSIIVSLSNGFSFFFAIAVFASYRGKTFTWCHVSFTFLCSFWHYFSSIRSASSVFR